MDATFLVQILSPAVEHSHSRKLMIFPGDSGGKTSQAILDEAICAMIEEALDYGSTAVFCRAMQWRITIFVGKIWIATFIEDH